MRLIALGRRPNGQSLGPINFLVETDLPSTLNCQVSPIVHTSSDAVGSTARLAPKLGLSILMWLNPLPAETVIGAIVGAVLSTIMAFYKYFEVNSWIDSRYAIQLTFLILVFGVCLHF